VRRLLIATLAATCTLVAMPGAPVHADDTPINQNPRCQAMWDQLATPVAARMLYMVQAGDQYPMLPNGRPTVGGPSYPWGPGVFAAPGRIPGYGGPYYGGAGIPGIGFGGPVPFASPFANPNVVPPVTVPTVTNQVINAAGSLTAVAPSDLISLGGLRQSLIGNRLGVGDLYQSYVNSNLAGATFNLLYAAYPMSQAVSYREVLEGLDFYVRNMCPRATDNGV